MKSLTIKIIAVAGILGLGIWFVWHNDLVTGESIAETIVAKSAIEMAEAHYGEEVREHAADMNLPAEYFLSLIVLECGGKKPSGNRFESHVYQALLDVQNGSRRKYENIKQETLADASEEAIRNLATSWGPFQLIGYKCVGLDVNIKDIRGDDAVYYGMLWISNEYGKFLTKKKFKDAFHYHNTGRKYPLVGKPKTHNPHYVHNGIKYMTEFEVLGE